MLKQNEKVFQDAKDAIDYAAEKSKEALDNVRKEMSRLDYELRFCATNMPPQPVKLYQLLDSATQSTDYQMKLVRDRIIDIYADVKHCFGARPIMYREVALPEPFQFSYNVELELLHIEFPALLPAPLRFGANYLPQEFRRKLEQWLHEQAEIIRFQPAMVVFLYHVCRETLPRATPRDFDNMERKCIINALEVCGVCRDSMGAMADMNYMVEDKRNYTELLIMKRGDFKKYLQSGVIPI